MRAAFTRLVQAFLIALSAAAVVAVPGSGRQAPPPTTPAVADGLDGRTLVAARVVGRELIEGTELTLSFDGGYVEAYAGCNYGSGRYRIDQGRLRMSDVEETLIGCGTPAYGQDRWLFGLVDGARLTERGSRVVLREGRVTITFIPALDPRRPDAIVGSWRLSGYKPQGERLRGLGYRPEGERDRAGLYLSDRIASVQSPCASASSNVRIRQAAATVTFLTTDASWQALNRVPRCSGARAEIDRVMREVLRGRVRVRRTADVLTVRRAGSVLRFERVRAGEAS